MFGKLVAVPLAAACLAAVGCFQSGANVDSRHVNVAAVHQSYEVVYDAAGDRTHHFARFRVGAGGTNLVLTPPAGVSANGQPLAARDGMLLAGTLPGKHYDGTAAGYQPDHDFQFTGPDGNTYRNRVRVERIDHHPAQPVVLSRAANHEVRFAGPPLRAGETATLAIDAAPAAPPAGAAGPPAPPAERMATARADAAGATSVVLPAAALSRLPDGAARMQWIRHWKRPLGSDTGGGGEIVAIYKSKQLAVTLVK